MRFPYFYVFGWLLPFVIGLKKEDLFPYGPEHGDIQLDNTVDDISSLEFHLEIPVVFYDHTHHSLYINSNGLISFLTDIPIFFNIQFPMEYPVIAPFYVDIDPRGSGKIFYRESHSEEILQTATKYFQQHFTTAESFDAKSVVIVTWDAVGAYDSKKDKVNTFQVIIASDSHDSYVAFLYLDIQWIYCDGKFPNLPEMRAQAAIMAGDGRATILPGSGIDQIRNIDKLSNVGDSGLWLFQIGNTGANGNIKSPDLNIAETAVSSQIPQTCAIGAAFCHLHAKCVDYDPGFCCQCDEGFFGNGRNCLKEEEPQRLTGKVTGTLNDQILENLDMHAYVVTADGRAYSAINGVDETLGFDMQTLLSSGVVVGWTFATRSGNILNGYQLTGGVFNHSMTIDYPQTGHHVKIEHNFLGLDIFNYIRVEMKIQGTVPSISHDSKIEVDDFAEEYTRTSPGIIRSHSTHTYHLQDSDINIPFIVDQTITFDECAFGPVDPTIQTVRLRVTRNYIIYDTSDTVVRFAVLTMMESLTSKNPCENAQCGDHSSCVVEGDDFSCLCDSGYEPLYEQVNGEKSTCIDINECQKGIDNCHANAECVNKQGSFGCRCNPGFSGDGVNCLQSVTCAQLICDDNAECIHLPGQSAQCRCNPGFHGSGESCEPVVVEVEDCSLNLEICDLNADCVYNPETGRSQCECIEGTVGNGYICVDEFADSCDVQNNCHPDASCTFDDNSSTYVCVCNLNFKGDGISSCDPDDTDEEVNCNVINNCHPQAHCVFDTRDNDYSCRCTAGFEGDGVNNCEPSEVTCDSVNICSVYAKCVLDSSTNKYVCHCLDGYFGDGIVCEPEDECNSHGDCDPNAQCLFDNVVRRYHCKCNYGYSGDGRECSLESEVSCNIINNCHQDAQCTYDHVTLNYVCSCNSGFYGDGYACTPVVTPCNIQNNCHVDAECAYDENERGYRCRCNQGFIGDGLSCVPGQSCATDPTECDYNADCLPHPSLNQYVCQCRPEFQGDGYTCTPVSSYEGDFLLVSQGMAILKIGLDSSAEPSRPLVLIPYQTAVGIDIDCSNGQFYWADASGNVILRAEYNGSNMRAIIDTNILSPESVAVDWVSGNIFWTDSRKDTIEVLRLETKERKVLFNTGLENPRGITVHPGQGKIYWTDWERTAPKIETANMDGTNREVFVAENLGLPNLLTIDYDRHDLCWADAGTQKIECISLNGQNRRTVIAPVAYPFGLTNNRDTLFWTDWESNTIQSASKIAYNLNSPIISPLGTQRKLYGLVYVPEVCPRGVTNLCAINNGGCKSLCLANGNGGRTCACPDEGDEEDPSCNEID